MTTSTINPFEYAATTMGGPVLVPPSGGGPKTTAKLFRAQWGDYQRRFRPLEDLLFDEVSYNNPALVTDYRDVANRSIDDAYGAAKFTRQTALGRYGLRVTPEQAAVDNRLASLSKTTSIVDAAAKIRQRIIDRNTEIVLGSTPNAGRNYGLRAEG